MSALTPPPRRPSMADVAQIAGVSHQTVSRVINAPETVKEATRTRVTEAMAALGYRRNMAARALASARSQLIGVISAGEARFGPTHALHAVEEASRAAGYVSTHVPATSLAEATAAARHLYGVGVEGLVAIAPTMSQVEEIIASRRDTPLVLIAAGAPVTEGVSVVAVNQEHGARLAVRHLARLGHSVVHHLAGPSAWFDAAARVTPSKPNLPGPWFSGMKGTQLAGSTYWMPKPRKAAMTATLIATTTALTVADCVMPT